MLSFLYRLVTSVWPHKRIYASTNPDIDLEDEWIAVVSDAEVKLADDEKNRVDDELALLRRRNSGGDRAFILGRVSEIFSKRDLSDLTRVILPADLRQKIYKDIFNKLSPEWLEQIKKIYPSLTSLEANWTPSTYEKNLLGQMIDMAEKSSPDHLSAPGFAQMIKTVHLCLTQSLALLTGASIDPSDSEALLEMLAKAIVPIVDLWLSTARKAQDSLSKQGRLPSKWSRELEDRMEQLKEKKSRGEIDARFVDGEQDEIRQRYVTKERIEKGLLVSHETILERQNLLQRRLRPTARPVEPHIPIDFKMRRIELEKRLRPTARPVEPHIPIDFKMRHTQLERLFKK